MACDVNLVISMILREYSIQTIEYFTQIFELHPVITSIINFYFYLHYFVIYTKVHLKIIYSIQQYTYFWLRCSQFIHFSIENFAKYYLRIYIRWHVTSDFSHFKILCQEKRIDLKMSACDSDLKLVAFLRACHLFYNHCNRFWIKFVHKFGLLILVLLRGCNITYAFAHHPCIFPLI